MKKIVLITLLAVVFTKLHAQKVDSIYFNLYTDSLKKGTHNYINIDGKLKNGRWLPLMANQIEFTTSDGTFEGNDLILPIDFKPEKVTIKAVLKNNPTIWKETTIWIKTKPNDDILPTTDEVINGGKKKKN